MTNWLQLDPKSPVALYLQIVEQVRRLVALGALRSGDRLPTVRELAARARVNRNTAARAVQLLEAEGLVRTRVGQGTFVADDAGELGREQRIHIVDAALDRAVGEADTVGFPLDELGGRLSDRIARHRRADRPGGAHEDTV